MCSKIYVIICNMDIIFNPKTIRAIAGLGNPGDEYRDTFHNMGRMFLCHAMEKTKSPDLSPYKTFAYSKKGKRVFMRPETFMNQSGKGLKEALLYFKLKPNQVLLVHDDADIPLGKMKLSFGRGSAGHKGVESVISHFKTKDFWRARIGIRTKQNQKKKALDIVLSRIGKKEEKELMAVFKNLEDLLLL